MSREILIQHFQAEGFELVADNSYKQITIAPDLIFERDSVVKAIVIRDSSDSLPESMIQRFSESQRIPSKTLEIYFAFPSKPTLKILTSCKLFAVGILYPDVQNNVQIYAEPKQKKGRKKVAAIPNTHIFFSSRQHLEEREIGEELINFQRESLHVPIFAMRVENDQQYSSDIRKLWKIIERCMDGCDFVLVILSGEYRRIIDRETRRALDLYEPEDILFYVKSDKETKEAWKDLLDVATAAGVKYTEYFDSINFRLKVNQRIMKVIKRLHKQHGVDFLEDGV